jgi:ribosomal protein S1
VNWALIERNAQRRNFSVSIESQVPEETPETNPTPETPEQPVQAEPEQAAVEEKAEETAPVTTEVIDPPEMPIIEEEPVEEPINPIEQALAQMDAMHTHKRGDLIEGTIVQVADDELIVDIGTKTEGIIKRDEISIGPNPSMGDFAVGDKVSVVVIDEDEEGQCTLSKRRADQRLVWAKVEESLKEGTRLLATGFRAVKGGLLVDIGTIAFLPQSLVDIRRVDDLEQFVGQKIDVKVVDYDRDAKPHPKIVVSRRAILEEDLTQERDQLYDSLDAGSVVDGKVIKMTNYGAFVDVGGLQGLLHISEMSLGRIKHPSEVMKEGDTIKVKILKLDKKKKRISLGRRELLPNPWDMITDKFKAGMVVEGIVVRTADFGAFIKLDDYFEGLAHISELVENKISHAKEVFNQGDKVNVQILNIDKKNRRIKLSVKRAVDAQRRAEVAEFMKEQGDLQNVFAMQLQDALKEADIDLSSEPEAPKEEATEESVAESTEETSAEETPSEETPAEEISAEPETSTALAEAPDSEIMVVEDEPAADEPVEDTEPEETPEAPAEEADAPAEPEVEEAKPEEAPTEKPEPDVKLGSEMDGTPIE